MERDVLIMVINDTRDRDGIGILFPCEIDDPFVGHPKFMCGHRGTPGERALFSSNKQVGDDVPPYLAFDIPNEREAIPICLINGEHWPEPGQNSPNYASDRAYSTEFVQNFHENFKSLSTVGEVGRLVKETMALRMLELVVPQHVVRGQNIKLECNFNLDGETLYSVKWYKDGNEFYRYVPQDRPPVLVFQLPGVTANIHNSTERSVVLYSVNLMSTGRYRCEVSAEAPSFQTVSDHSDMLVVALPEDGPIITGRPGRHRYQVGDVVRFNCTSAKSKPAAMLSWFINGDPVDTQYLRGPHITEVDREGLETAVLGLEFRLRTKHFKRGDLKIKCLATIATVYWKSNELSIEGERPLKMPVMESRETRAQGHTHAEHILGGKR
ncbi:hypothetical protein WN51_12811 [Melipona quadrifasciata]|uniref:Ig-like domain-containing protein n=1 Tax=Melipona quadrifasciata TaxID=166423 RepID=A0A0N0BH70_9HYME|nr:hypothetical protein WN51_12811 [Melipona quadrifasciata]